MACSPSVSLHAVILSEKAGLRRACWRRVRVLNYAVTRRKENHEYNMDFSENNGFLSHFWYAA
jgi:hypothetical protein